MQLLKFKVRIAFLSRYSFTSFLFSLLASQLSMNPVRNVRQLSQGTCEFAYDSLLFSLLARQRQLYIQSKLKSSLPPPSTLFKKIIPNISEIIPIRWLHLITYILTCRQNLEIRTIARALVHLYQVPCIVSRAMFLLQILWPSLFNTTSCLMSF